MTSVKYDWYQSETKVVISVLLKNAKDKNYSVDIQPDSVEVKADDYNLLLNLLHPINVEQSTHKAMTTKIEISLAKMTGERWSDLTKKQEEAAVPTAGPTSLNKKNWDKFEKEVEKSEQEEAKDEEALQNLFKKIYGSGNEEVRKAMNKSFMESGGTVLSTNWKEVGSKQVEVKPPDGCEFKKWDE